MRLKSHSLMLGYREFQAWLRRQDGKVVVVLEELGPIQVVDYIKNGFSVKEATEEEMHALVKAGYESSRLLLRNYKL